MNINKVYSGREVESVLKSSLAAVIPFIFQNTEDKAIVMPFVSNGYETLGSCI
jgi:hypothetical protein